MTAPRAAVTETEPARPVDGKASSARRKRPVGTGATSTGEGAASGADTGEGTAVYS